MLSHSKHEAHHINTKLSQTMDVLASEGEQDVAQYVSVLQARQVRIITFHARLPYTSKPWESANYMSSNFHVWLCISAAHTDAAVQGQKWNQLQCTVPFLQGLLNHTVVEEVEELDGMYKQAFDRIINQVVCMIVSMHHTCCTKFIYWQQQTQATCAALSPCTASLTLNSKPGQKAPPHCCGCHCLMQLATLISQQAGNIATPFGNQLAHAHVCADFSVRTMLAA